MKQHPLAWVIWVCCSAGCALLTRNPLYQVILALSAWLVLAAANPGSGQGGGWLAFVRLGALVWVIAIPFNALMFHQGSTVLFSLPANWPLVGGNITLEAVLYGVAAGLVLWVLLLLFSAFNAVMDVSELIRLAPPVFYQVTIVTSIGLTFVPQMIKSSQEIREAQRVRGHRFRSWRDLTPLIMPLLTTSLERAMMLAESMESRGFGGDTDGLSARDRLVYSLAMLLSLVILLTGLVMRLWLRASAWWASGLLLLAAAGIVYTLVVMARHTRRSHYRRQRWTWSDTLIAAGSAAALAALVVVRSTNNLALSYYPFPPNGLLPGFIPWLGLALLLCALPGLLSIIHENPGRNDARQVNEAKT
ncbi:MAG: energy-coupling factor transporter transmembrane component T [Anaerolineae bacterium]